MKRRFDEYLQEAIDKGWWEASSRPAAEDAAARHHRDRRQPAAPQARRRDACCSKELWPKLKIIVSIDWRMQHHRPLLGLHPAGGAALREDQLPLSRCRTS